MKAQLQDEKKNHGEQMVTKAEYDQVVRDNKKLDKQKVNYPRPLLRFALRWINLRHDFCFCMHVGRIVSCI